VLPLFVAAGSVAIGVGLGAFVAVQMLSTPAKLDARSQQASLAPKPAAVAAETTGSAAFDDGGKGCDGQTWPYLSRNCVQQAEVTDAKSVQDRSALAQSAQGANTDAPKIEPEPKSLRVVAPDNVEPAAVAAIETKPAAASEESTARSKDAAPGTTPGPVTPAAVSAAPAAAETPAAAAVPAATTVSETAPLPLAKPHAKSKPVRTAKKIKHKPRIENEAKPEEQDDSRVASSGDDEDDQPVVRAERSRHIGRRGYDAAPYGGRDGRRVVVIRREEEPFRGPFGRGGLFGGLFGGF